MEWLTSIYDWFASDPYVRIPFGFTVANLIVQKTPWKGDDDLLKMAKDVFAAFVGIKKGK